MSELEKLQSRLAAMTAQRDLLLVALEDLLEHEGTVDQTGIGDFPSEALVAALSQAADAIEAVKSENAEASSP